MKQKSKQILLCFVEGEPTLYNTATKQYVEVKVDYEEILQLMKPKIQEFEKRPQMRIIWGLFSDLLPCCDKYNEYHNKRNKLNYNSFESRLTRDLTEYLDTLFIRGLSEQEKIAKEKLAEEKSKHVDMTSYPALRASRQKMLAQKRGRTRY